MRQLILVEANAVALGDAVRRVIEERGSIPVLVAGSGALADKVRDNLAMVEPKCEVSLEASASVARAGSVVVLTATTGKTLADELITLVDVDDLTVLAPVTEWHYSRRPLFLISIPKAGTHLLYELAQALGYATGQELGPSVVAEGGKWYCVEFTNSHTVARDFFVDSVRRARFGHRAHAFPRSPALFIFRHPLDVLVSEARYYGRDGKTVFAGYFAGKSLDERIAMLLDDPWLLGSLRDRIGGFLPWLSFPNVVPLSFEELVGESGGGSRESQLRLIWSIMLKLQVPGRPDAVAARVFNPHSPTFNEGQAGAYAKTLTPEVVADFESRNGDLLSAFGYAPGQGMVAPDIIAARRRRVLECSSVDYSSMPLTIREDLLGCNLVRYKDEFYAVPRQSGPIALEAVDPVVLRRLPRAATLSALEALLLLGADQLAQRFAAADQIGEMLRSGGRTGGAATELEETGEPFNLLESYRGFNLLTYHGAFVALRQSIGEVVLDAPVQDIKARYGEGDVIAAADLEGLRQLVDSFVAVRGVGEQLAVVAARQASLPPAVARLTAGLAAEAEHVAALARDQRAGQEVVARLASDVDGLSSTLAARAEDAELLHTIVTRVEDDVAQLRSELEPASSTLKALTGERDELRRAVARLEAEVAQSRSALASASSVLTALIGERDELRASVSRIEEGNEAVRSAHAAFVAEQERAHAMAVTQIGRLTQRLDSGLIARVKRVFAPSTKLE